MIAFLLSGLFGAQKYLVRIIVTVKDAPDGIAFIGINEIPRREYFRFRTSFPGDEVRDGIELVTRAVLKGRYFVDTSIAPDFAPQTPANGAMYFEVAYLDRAFAYSFDHHIFTKEWAEEVIKHQEGSLSEEEHARYLEYKYEVLGKLLTRMNVFNYREPIPVSRFNC